MRLNSRLIGAVVAAVTIAGACIWMVRRASRSTVTAIIRVELPMTNGWPTTEPEIFLHLLTKGRDLGRNPIFLREIATDAGLLEGAVRSMRMDQYRCTSLIDARFSVSGRDVAERVAQRGSARLLQSLTTNFPGIGFEVISRKIEP